MEQHAKIQGSPDSADLLTNSKTYFRTLIRVEHSYIMQARQNPFFFMEYVTGMTPAEHHIQWLNDIFSKDASRVNIVAFPGSGKSHVLIYAIAWLIGVKPGLTNIICSVNKEQAAQRLNAIMELVELNERYKNVFPWIQKDKRRPNNQTTMNVWSKIWEYKGRKFQHPELDYMGWRKNVTEKGEPKDHTLFAAGITSKTVIGKRCTGIMGVDDPHDYQNSGTEQQRLKVVGSFRNTILTRLVPTKTARCVVISTRWAETDMAGTLMEEVRQKTGGKVWATTVTPVEDPDTGEPTWPKVWGTEQIDDRSDEVGGREGPMFQLSYMNNPLGEANGEVTMDMLRFPLPDKLPDFKDLVISVDFAHTENLKSDYTVCTLIGRDDAKPFNVYILAMIRFKKGQINEKVAKLAEFADWVYDEYNRLDAILFENKDSMHEVDVMRQDHPDLPIKIISTKGDKERRFDGIAYRIQKEHFFINITMPHYGALCTELVGFPGATHDDIVDTISLPFQQPSWRADRMRSGRVEIKSQYVL